MFYESDEGDVNDDGIIAQTVYGDDDSGVAEDDGIISQNVYGDDDSGLAKDEDINEQAMYYEEEEEGAAKDDGIVAQSMYYDEEEGAAKDEGIIAQSQYYDEEEGAQKDDGITAQSQYYDEEEGAKKDEGIMAQSQYYDEDEGAAKDEDILAQNVYGEDDSGKAPEEAIGQPKTFPEEKIAQAEPSKPVTVLPVTVTVEAEPLFDFDRSAVRADSKRKLDELLQQLKGVTFGEVVAVGFADPIGAAMYNQKLSERRASSVKAYLSSHGIPADKIRVEGRGETEEYASYESCGGLRKKKLIACLQPDRRVEVTVTAEKQQ
jgi:outer membrane protein OmpA-like peptidoglycan-associated protein